MGLGVRVSIMNIVDRPRDWQRPGLVNYWLLRLEAWSSIPINYVAIRIFTNGRLLRNVITSPPLRRSLHLESGCQRGWITNTTCTPSSKNESPLSTPKTSSTPILDSEQMEPTLSLTFTCTVADWWTVDSSIYKTSIPEGCRTRTMSRMQE